MDIAIVNYETDTIGILLGYGNGIFHDLIIYSIGLRSEPTAIAVNDLDRDNHLDLVLNNGTFLEPKSYTLGDINNDNLLDIVIFLR